jgi:ankyrin repeat protein
MLVRSHNPFYAAILQAAADGDLELLQQPTNLQALDECVCTSGCTALHWAAGMNQIHVIRYLLNLPSSQEGVEPLPNHPVSTGSSNKFVVDIAIPKKYKAAGRTPLHYAARNGCLEATQCLIEEFHAKVNVKAKHGVTPLHLAFFQNQKNVAEYLLQYDDVDLFQTNEYGCNVLHWLAICPASRAGPNGGSHLVPTARWLYEMQQQKLQQRVDTDFDPSRKQNESNEPSTIDLFHAKQTQGHTVLHKAAWLGHIALVRYLHQHHNVWDDLPDVSGNYAVTLAEMARHNDDTTVNYLRMFCSRSAAYSCSILGIANQDMHSPYLVRQAYFRMAKKYHPDRQTLNHHEQSTSCGSNEIMTYMQIENKNKTTITFGDIYQAYHHLMYEKGQGLQCNAAHKLNILLPPSDDSTNLLRKDLYNGTTVDDDCFKARLIVVLREYGEKGLDVSNLKKKWKQVWKQEFPYIGSTPLTLWITRYTSDVVEVRIVNQCHRVYPILPEMRR